MKTFINTDGDLVYKVECGNCGQIIEITEYEISGEDYIDKECDNCLCEAHIEVEYNIDEVIVDLHVY